MNWTLIPASFIPAGAGLIGVLVGSGISTWTTRRTHRERLAADQALAERKIAADIQLARERFRSDNEFSAIKRLVELVEPTLADFYSAFDAIQFARFPGSFGGEGTTRVQSEGETEDERRHLNTLYIPVERMQKNIDVFSRIFASRYRFQANFGLTAAAPFIKLKEIQGDISAATFGLINERRGRLSVLHDQWEATIWEGLGDVDPIKPKLNEMITKIEAISQPILERASG